MKEVVLATSNPHKLSEINAIKGSKNVQFELVGADFDPDETGSTFSENAYIKAFEAAKLTGKPALADDSGLCVNFLNGEPGIKSARYDSTPEKRIEKLLKNLEGVPFEDRTAHFNCTMALVSPDGKLLHETTGRVHGIIDTKVKGKNGFGYDPIFFIPDRNMTLAELDEDTKNAISHRANALNPMLDWIVENLT